MEDKIKVVLDEQGGERRRVEIETEKRAEGVEEGEGEEGVGVV